MQAEGASHPGAFGKEDSKEIVPVVPILTVSRTLADVSLRQSTLAKRLCSSHCDPSVCDICLISVLHNPRDAQRQVACSDLLD